MFAFFLIVKNSTKKDFLFVLYKRWLPQRKNELSQNKPTKKDDKFFFK